MPHSSFRIFRKSPQLTMSSPMQAVLRLNRSRKRSSFAFPNPNSSWSTNSFDERIFVPAKFAVADVVDGFSTALQHMRIGDRWKVYIPYQLGYGTNVNGSIPAYSTLIFDMALAAYYHPGKKVPDWSANEMQIWEEP